jgi:hypothetical protein
MVIIAIGSLLFPAFGQERVRPQKMTFSYVNHPVIVNELIPIVREAYASLGIETQYIEQPSDRNLREINKGLLDGDVVFSRLLLVNYPDLILIEPPLVTSIFILICQPQLICDNSVIEDPSKLLVLTDASHTGLKQWFGNEPKIGLYIINNLSTIPQLVTDRRADYGMYVMSASQLKQIDETNFHYHELFRTESYHILNPKYAYLKADVENAIRQVIAKTESAKDLEKEN